MISLLRRLHVMPPKSRDEDQRRVDDADDRVRDLKERADRVAPELRGRQARNGWAEAIAALYQGGHP